MRLPVSAKTVSTAWVNPRDIKAEHSSERVSAVRSERRLKMQSFAALRRACLELSVWAAVALALCAAAFAQMPVGQGVPYPLGHGKAQLVGHYPPHNMLRLVIGLKTPHPAEEEQFLKDLQTKGSPVFRKYLSPDQWNQRFAPSAADEQAVVDWAQGQGLTVTNRYANHLIVDLQAPAGVIEKAFGVTINQYSSDGVSFFSNDRDPQVPANLSGVVLSVLGLNSWDRGAPHNHKLPQAPQSDYAAGPVAAAGGNSHGNGNPAKRPNGKSSSSAIPNFMGSSMEPPDIFSQGAYDTNALYAQGHCCNPTGLASAGPVTSIAIATAGTYYNGGSDLGTFFNQYGMAWDYNYYYIDGTPGCCDGEGTMDTEWAEAMANSFGSYQNTAHEYIYQGVNSNFSTFTDIFNTMLSNGYARTMTTSWGWIDATLGGSNMNTWHNIFNSMVGQGWTLIAASGDGGASYSCQNFNSVSYPASDPDVLAAGGTTLRLDTSDDFLSEVAWSGGPDGCTTNDGGSTGGCSVYWGNPSYQSSSYCGGYRAVPDIALNADWYNTPQVLYFQGGWQGNGGTSIVAPETAGFMAQVNAYQLALPAAYGGTGLGNVNYAIYNSATYGAPHNPRYDTTSGCNNNDDTSYWGLTYYCAGTGYDEVTGWGSFNMLQMAWAINWEDTSDTGSPAVTFSGPTTNHWFNYDVAVSWTVADTGGGGTVSGVAGFSQAWDSDPGNGDPGSEANGNPLTYYGTFGYPSNSFYSGPQFPNATSGYLDVSWIGQGCHTAYVRAWDNMGLDTYTSYGPVCYDTVAPTTSTNLTTTSYTTPITVTLTGVDPSPGSGVAGTDFGYYYNGVWQGWHLYAGSFTLSNPGSYGFYYYSYDYAGNSEVEEYVAFTIKPGLIATPASLTFTVKQVVGTVSAAKTITVKNQSVASITINNVSVSANFKLSSNTCSGVTLAATKTCTLGVQFAPTNPAALKGAVTVTSTGDNPTMVVSLAGTGVYPLSFSVASLSFPSTAVGSTAGPLTAKLTNNSSAAIPLGTRTASQDFIGSGATVTSDNCGSSLAAGATCLFDVYFQPNRSGSTYGVITVPATTSPAVYYLSLSGTGSGTAPLVTIGAGSFSNTFVGATSAAKTLTLKNGGATALTITSKTIRGPFAVTGGTCTTLSGGVLSKGLSCTYTVTFTPAGVGAVKGSLTIFYNNGTAQWQIAGLSGTGIPAVTFSAASLSYGTVLSFTNSGTKTVTITNNQPIAISSLALATSGDFYLSGTTCGSSLGAHSTCTATIYFGPTQHGGISGSLAVSGNQPGSAQLLTLIGSGN